MRNSLFFKARKAAGLSQQEVGDLLHVTRKSIQDWENNSEKAIPDVRAELFMLKLEEAAKVKGNPVVVLVDNRGDVIDVFCEDAFCGMKQMEYGNFQVTSLTIDRNTRQAIIHKCIFPLGDNAKAYNRMLNLTNQLL